MNLFSATDFWVFSLPGKVVILYLIKLKMGQKATKSQCAERILNKTANTTYKEFKNMLLFIKIIALRIRNPPVRQYSQFSLKWIILPLKPIW